MINGLVVNELSFAKASATQAEARDLMARFIEAIKVGLKYSSKVNLQIQEDFYSLILSTEYRVFDWASDSLADIEDRRVLLAITTSAPFASNPLLEYSLDSEICVGLGLAHEQGSIAVSLLTDAVWDISKIAILRRAIDPEGEIQELVVSVLHASSNDHVTEIVKQSRRDLLLRATSGLDVFKQVSLFFSVSFLLRTSV